MPTEISIKSLFPAISTREVQSNRDKIRQTTFVGIDFGTSTTVASIAYSTDDDEYNVKTRTIWLNQKLFDGSVMSSEKTPTAIAWLDKQLFIGQCASDLKYSLQKGVNIWYSFKMELGEDLGSKYYNSELDRNSPFPILNPKDAARVFFAYLKAQIERFVRTNNLPEHIHYAISIPASFEANQRKELIEAIEQNGIVISKQCLIDEPNAAFLSYVQNNSTQNTPLVIPDGELANLLVFDFGAGTCDISILELGKNLNGAYSKNLSISKFEKLGGDDIDWAIAEMILLPRLLASNNKSKQDFRTQELRRIITKLLKSAEQLKILISDNVALQMQNRVLPDIAIREESVRLDIPINIDTRKGVLSLNSPSLTYSEFKGIMDIFLSKSKSRVLTHKALGDYTSIYLPIDSALKKANLKKDEIDYVLFIGGSSKNPYVQAALKEYLNESEIIIPNDLQTHVSSGTAIHSLIYGGYGKNVIQPITSEPLIVLTKDDTTRVLLKAGTHIPCDLIVIDDLVSGKDGQRAIELPICLGSKNKILYNIQIICQRENGFPIGTPVRLEIEITTDKLLLARASAVGQEVYVEPINPFANKELDPFQRNILKAERQANIDAENNGGVPTLESLDKLFKAYEAGGNSLRAAETLEIMNELKVDIAKYNEIGVLYSNAGYDEKALEYYELAYSNKKNATSAFNYAYKLKDKDRSRAKEILIEATNLNPELPHPLFELGTMLLQENKPEGRDMVKKSYEIWKAKFEKNQMSESDYGWLASAAETVGMREFANQVRQSKPSRKASDLYNEENLTTTTISNSIIKF